MLGPSLLLAPAGASPVSTEHPPVSPAPSAGHAKVLFVGCSTSHPPLDFLQD